MQQKEREQYQKVQESTINALTEEQKLGFEKLSTESKSRCEKMEESIDKSRKLAEDKFTEASSQRQEL